MLVLSHADALRIDLDQLGQWIHEPTADRHRATHREIVLGELLAGDVGSGVHRGARLVDHHDRDGRRQVQRSDEAFRFAAGGAITDSNRLHAVRRDKVA